MYGKSNLHSRRRLPRLVHPRLVDVRLMISLEKKLAARRAFRNTDDIHEIAEHFETPLKFTKSPSPLPDQKHANRARETLRELAGPLQRGASANRLSDRQVAVLRLALAAGDHSVSSRRWAACRKAM